MAQSLKKAEIAPYYKALFLYKDAKKGCFTRGEATLLYGRGIPVISGSPSIPL